LRDESRRFGGTSRFIAQTRHEHWPTDVQACTPKTTFAAHCFAISLDITTQRASAVVVTVHAWQISVNES
jgi:hypothetical protein